ncbi:MAG: hypothetical protein JNM14_01565 [Ferruginibacter sp.]|nr:hypothetical protein [Ferruginibacter sp.]
MKKVLLVAALFTTTAAVATNTTVPAATIEVRAVKYDIKIKNDSGDEVTVYNPGSGGTYRLQKNVVTTIKMEEGDKLYKYEGGKKGALLLTASADMNGKVQLLSKL